LPGFKTLARAALGFALGLLVWWGLTPPYNRLVAACAEPLIRLRERPAATRLYAEAREIVVERADFPSDSGRPGLPADDLTFNVGILTALAATEAGLLRDRGARRVALSFVLLFATHVLALVANVESLYATQLGPWSEAHYGPVSRNLWATAAHFYRLVGMYAVAFLLWWVILRGAGGDGAPPAGRGKRKR
jgi:hypothetical protein